MANDRGLFISLVCVLLGFGTLMVHSASITSWPTEFEQVYLSRHVFFLLVGVSAAGICSVLPARFWFRVSPFLFTTSAFLLVLVLVPGIGTKVNGAQRWLRYGAFSMQPSELAKIALPLFLCRLVCHHRENFNRWFVGTVPLLFPMLLMALLVMLQPDLGTAIFLAGGAVMALFVGGWPIRYFLLSGGVALPVVGYFISMKAYQLERITGFLAAWNDLDQAPYQMKQSLVSLGAGGIFGVGLGKGWQKLSFLPEANTDFAFAVVGEELGLVGTLGLMALWVGFYAIGLRLLRHRDRQSFEYLAGFTLLTQLVLQAALNTAVVTAMVPPKGIPHPLLSYGGSNLVVSLLSIGIVISLSRNRQDGEAMATEEGEPKALA